MTNLEINVSPDVLRERIRQIIALASQCESVADVEDDDIQEAMHLLLTGHHPVDNNPKNLSTFWPDKSQEATWIGYECYSFGIDTGEVESLQYTGNSKEEVEHKLFGAVLGRLSAHISKVIDPEALFQHLDGENSEFCKHFFKTDLNNQSMTSFFEKLKYESLSEISTVFHYCTTMLQVNGAHSIRELPKQRTCPSCKAR